MTKNSYFWLLFVTAIVLDQLVKELILGGFRWESSCISIVLAFNDGVAFSMFSFLKEWLKYIQIAILLTIFVYIFATTKLANIKLPLGLLLGAGVSNVIACAIKWAAECLRISRLWLELSKNIGSPEILPLLCVSMIPSSVLMPICSAN